MPPPLAKLMGSMTAGPLFSACLPDAAHAVMPCLQSVHLPSFQQKEKALVAASLIQRLQAVLAAAPQVIATSQVVLLTHSA